VRQFLEAAGRIMSRSKEFFADRRGNVAITFAFVLMVLLGVAGIAMDYAVAVHRKKSMDQALDNAVLAATNAAADAKASGNAGWRDIGLKAARVTFDVNLPPQTDYRSLSFVPVIELDGWQLKTSATYTGQSDTSFMKLFGFDTVDLAGSAAAGLTAGNYIDVNFVVDNSASMGIGADLASQQKMIAKSKTHPGSNVGCALACHHSIGSLDYITPEEAAAAGAKLRIDIVRESVIAAIDSLKTQMGGSERLRIGLHTFSVNSKTLIAPTTDTAAVLAAAKNIRLDTSNVGGGTFMNWSMNQVAAKIARGGTGASKNDRLSFVVLFTDGIEDSVRMEMFGSATTYSNNSITNENLDWWTNQPLRYPLNSWMQAFNPQFCNRFKRTDRATTGNHSLMAIRVKYLVPPNLEADPRVAFITSSLPAPLQTSFSTCVSKPDYYVTASTTAEIAPAFDKIISEIVKERTVALAK
jgi:hypothetical protein